MAGAAPDSRTKLPWRRLDGLASLGGVRGPWGLATQGVRTLDMDWQEERPWGTTGTATAVLGWLRRWAYHLVGRLHGRYLRAPRSRALTLGGFVEGSPPGSRWREAQRRLWRVVPTRSLMDRGGRGTRRKAPRSDLLNPPLPERSVPASLPPGTHTVASEVSCPVAILWEGLRQARGRL